MHISHEGLAPSHRDFRTRHESQAWAVRLLLVAVAVWPPPPPGSEELLRLDICWLQILVFGWWQEMTNSSETTG